MGASGSTSRHCPTKYVGVVISDDLSERGLKALKWADKFLTKPPNEGYKLCVFLMETVAARNSPAMGTGTDDPPHILESRDKLEGHFMKKCGRQKTIRFQHLTDKFGDNIVGRLYQGASIRQILPRAITELPELEVLIVDVGFYGRQEEQGLWQLQLPAGCSIVVIKDSDTVPGAAGGPPAAAEAPTRNGLSTRPSARAPQ
ncbi:hypothetical protein BS78_08G006600 [Paspalum vaginatum]|nr:hypothetical protein BS78_08G006600 [Paspalum vaginatum]